MKNEAVHKSAWETPSPFRTEFLFGRRFTRNYRLVPTTPLLVGKGCWRQPSVALSGRLRCGLILVSSARIPGSFGVMNNPRPFTAGASFLASPSQAPRKPDVIWVNLNRSAAARERSSLQDALSRL